MQVLNGFVKIHRKLLQWGWYQDNVVKGVFLHLLLTASFQDSQWMGRTIKKGQVVTSYNSLAQEITSKELGEMVCEGLKTIDEVAYVRFASVYRSFTDTTSFIKELEKMVKKDKNI